VNVETVPDEAHEEPQLVNICGYKLATNWQKFQDIIFSKQRQCKKILGATFSTHPVGRYVKIHKFRQSQKTQTISLFQNIKVTD